MKLLLITFSTARAMTLKRVLDSLGHQVVTAGNDGFKAWQKAKDQGSEFQAFVLDLEVRPGHSIETGEAIARGSRAREVMRCWLDGKESDREKVRQKVGASECFVTIDELIEKLKSK